MTGLVLFALAGLKSETITIKTAEGPIVGRVEDGVNVFKGVPYAEPPVGDLRWKSAVPHKPWKEPRECFEFGAAAPQFADINNIRPTAPEKQSEDCLFLNVWAPEKAKDRPVMVWIHGGGHKQGAGSLAIYDGENFAKNGVVLVTINYRLGIFGFLAHPLLTKEAGSSGNYGYLDQVEALKWVQRNIASFGGNPNNVTVFGESAGAVSCGALVASPMAKGLFQHAVLESGGPTRTTMSLAEAEQQGADYIDKTDAKTLSEMRALSTKTLLDLTPATYSMPGEGAKDWPCVDGKFLTMSPGDAWAKGKVNKVPLMVGSNANEGALWAKTPTAKSITAQRLDQMWNVLFPSDSDAAKKVYPHATDEEARQSFIQGMTDGFIATVRRAGLDMAKTGTPVYQYHFARSAPLYDRLGLGAFHGAEISYVFGNMNAPFFRSEDRELSKEMNAAWIRFATTGDPNGGGLVPWPKFGSNDESTMVWDIESHVANGIRLEAMRLMDR